MKPLMKSRSYLIYIFLFIYLVLNLSFLVDFPFVHSDESWLSGLARNITNHHDFSVTEPFFDLKDRYPHAIKSVFHGIQILFMRAIGYNIFSMRLISLIFGVLSLYYVYKLAMALWGKENIALGALLLTSFDIQFIYASHFARQEIILVFVLVLCLYLFFKNKNEINTKHSTKTAVLLGCIIGLSIGVHPNSFIISLPLLFLYVYHIFISKRLALRSLLYFLITISGFAILFIGLSFSFDPSFITHYKTLGQDFQVFNPLSAKLVQFKLFYLKLFYQISGTYYTPNIRFQFFFFPLILLVSLGLTCIKNKNTGYLLLSIAALNLGLILIGRYNQTSVVFQFPLLYLLASYCIYSLPRLKAYLRQVILGFVVLTLGVLSVFNITPYLTSVHGNSYENYLLQIGKVVSPEAEVLANLNTEYYFELGKLHDYRNLSYLKDKNIAFAEYIKAENIEYILYPEEMDVIYEERPRWNGMYGTLVYYEEMKEYLEKNCRLIYEFSAPIYGMRIVDYLGKKDWQVKIYQVNT
ncbi:MAG: 4-amino-4-deoxy-L-arabinose transferase [Firmicutes bacterium HGW-Firmicutes-12]|nr:MAG: 4-amino-4-deoxy-L-arabinose transferase [Firmicutes bacterium HGW-Firmicutes-12]